MNQQNLPLAGIRVVDYSHFLAGPYLSRCLAGLGADVVKVERPKQGDAGRVHAYIAGPLASGYFLQQNMGKKGLCINIKDPRGLELVKKLVDSVVSFQEKSRTIINEMREQATKNSAEIRDAVEDGKRRLAQLAAEGNALLLETKA